MGSSAYSRARPHTTRPPGEPPGPRGVSRRLRLDEAAADRVARQLDAVPHAELLEHVRAVAVNGLLAEEEDLGDLLARVALGNQLDDLELARRQRIRRCLLATLGGLEEVAHDAFDRSRIKKRLAAH